MVDSILSTGLQGVNSGLQRTREAAQDIATATTTDEFSSGTGVQDPLQGNPLQAPQPVQSTDVTGDLAESIVDLKIGENQVKASAAVIRTADEMMGTLIDTKA